MRYRRLPIEIESPEERGYDTIRNNLTESSVRDLSLGGLGIDLGDLVLCYGDHRGSPRLRSVIAAQSGLREGDVLTTPGAAGALFIVATTLLEPSDHLVVAHTNYATNLETPRLVGARITPLPLRFEDGFALDLAKLGEVIASDRVTLVSLTYPHNPTGATITPDELESVVGMVESAGAWLLVDETYRDLTHREPLPVAATLSDRAISVSSVSKSYGLPGIRVGWILCRNPVLIERFLAAKEQIVICGSAVDESIAAHVLERRDIFLPPIRAAAAAHLDLVTDWMHQQQHLEWVPPRGGVVCLPRLGAEVDPDRFYLELNARGTYVGEGHWFDTDRRFFRLGYGWPSTEELEAGLADITAAANLAATNPPDATIDT